MTEDRVRLMHLIAELAGYTKDLAVHRHEQALQGSLLAEREANDSRMRGEEREANKERRAAAAHFTFSEEDFFSLEQSISFFAVIFLS